MCKNAAFYNLFIGTITHDQEKSIDFVIASILFTNSIIKYYVKLELDCTSNHQTIYTTIEYSKHCKSLKPGKRFCLNQIKEKEFMRCLKK